MAKELKKNKAQMVMPESKEDKKKALESAIAHILKTYSSCFLFCKFFLDFLFHFLHQLRRILEQFLGFGCGFGYHQ